MRINMIIFFMFFAITSVSAKNRFQSAKQTSDPNTNATELQQVVVKGTVTDQQGLPIIGATVFIKGTSIGSNTDVSGNYSLARVPQNATVVFSFIGMTSQEILFTGQTRIDVVMKESISTLEDVVVIGYATVKKPDVTGSVGIVPVKDMAKATAVASFAEAMAGRVAGVQVSAIDGQPGATVNITIRGVSSLTQSTSPLFVIDGFPIESLA